MRWGKVEITGGFLLLLAWLNYCDKQMLLPAILSAAAIHETGHWAAIRTVHGRIGLLRLSAVGAELRLEGTLSYPKEIICALAGPAANLVVAVLTAKMGKDVFSGLNLALGVFNLLPISVLDGGRALNCLYVILLGPDVGYAIRRGVDVLLALGLLLGGTVLLFKGGSVTLLLVAMWILSRKKERIR